MLYSGLLFKLILQNNTVLKAVKLIFNANQLYIVILERRHRFIHSFVYVPTTYVFMNLLEFCFFNESVWNIKTAGESIFNTLTKV